MENLIGKKIKQLRRMKDVNQTQLAEAIGVKPQTISQYETGTTTPSLEKMTELAIYFGVNSSIILNGILDDEPKEKSVNIIEEMQSTIEYLKGQVNLLNSERSRFLDLLEKSFPEGSSNVSTGCKHPDYTPLRLVA